MTEWSVKQPTPGADRGTRRNQVRIPGVYAPTQRLCGCKEIATAGAGSVVVTVLGVLLVLLVLADVFLTVLFPASGHGPLREPLSRWTWRRLVGIGGRLPPERRRRLLAYSGPVIISQTILVWLLLLILGWALVYLPALGTGIVAAQGRTDDGFATALYVSGFTVTTLGTGDVVPVDPVYRLLVVTEAAVGFSVVTLVLTYFLSTYGAVTRRRTFASQLHHQTFGTGSAAHLLAGLTDGQGRLAGRAELAAIASHLTEMGETHTSYPVLAYFHYRHERYAIPRMLLVALEAGALVRSAIRPSSCPELLRSAVLVQLEDAAQGLLDELLEDERADGVAHGRCEEWRRRYSAAHGVLAAAGLPVTDEEDGARRYVTLRSRWDGRLRSLARTGGYDWGLIEGAAA